jgi:hypothetical protein
MLSARRHHLLGQAQVTKASMAEQQNAKRDLEQQMQVAMDAFQETAVCLLRTGEVHPQVIVTAAAQAAGELGAGLAVAGGENIGRVLAELAAILQQAGQDHGMALAVAMAPAAGSA